MPPSIPKARRNEQPRVVFVHRRAVSLDKTKKSIVVASAQCVAKNFPGCRVLPEEETQPSVLLLPAQAWICHEMCVQGALKRSRSKALFYAQLIPLTLATICSSVLYGHSNTHGWHPGLDDPLKIALFASTILFPVYITWLLSKEKELRAAKPYDEAAARIASETFQFRSGVSPYHSSEDASLHLKIKLQEILGCLLRDFEADGNSLPAKEFWKETPPPTTSTPVLKASRVFPPPQSPSPVCVMEQHNESLLIAELPSRTSSCRSSPRVKRRKIDLEKGPPTENTELLSTDSKESTNTDEDKKLGTATKKRIIVDDCISPLTSEEYLQIRNQKWLSQKTLEVQSAKRQKEAFSKVIQGITVSCSAVSIISMQWMVPIILAMATALGSAVEVAKLRSRIELGEKTVGQLEDLNIWWTTELTSDQKDELSQKERLVTETEHIILHGKLS